jgi:3-hydroxyisobutyrate dehydrogenase
MTRIGFIGLGNMGGPMAVNLAKAGYDVTGFDLSDAARKAAAEGGVRIVDTVAEAAGAGGIVVSMLPDGPVVRKVYMGEHGVIANAAADALMIDCSTIDVDSARAVADAAGPEQAVLDAPVSGGVEGSKAGKLTFMVGGDADAFARAKPLFDVMGKAAVHAGQAGNGQVAKACNNMILGISMLAISEAFTLGEKQGLDPQKLFEISSQASGSCWAMLNHNPVPGLVETAAANRGYTPGFAAGMMWKDLKLAQTAAQQAGVATPLGAEAQALYALFCGQGHEAKDYSGIFRMLRGEDVE